MLSQVLSLGLVVAVGAAQPFVRQAAFSPTSERQQQSSGQTLTGKWTANLAKSQRDPNHLFESATLTISVSGETVTLTHDGINMAGHRESGTTILQADGKEHPASEQAPQITVLTRWIGSHTLETMAKKDGQVIGQGTYSLSDDGKTLTVTIWGTDARGRRFEQVIVFDRQ